MSARPSTVRPVGTPTNPGTPRALRAYLSQPVSNPGGQPKRQRSVAKAIREMLSHDPTGLIVLLLDIAEDTKARDSDRIAAIRELLDRGYGKAPEHAPIQDGDPLEMGDLERAISDIIHRRHPDIEATAEPVGELPAGEPPELVESVEAADNPVEIG